MRQIHGKQPSPLSPFLGYAVHIIPIIMVIGLSTYLWYINNPHQLSKFLSDTTSTPTPTVNTDYSELSQCILEREQETIDRDIRYADGSLIIQFNKTVPQGEGIDILFKYKDLQIVHELRTINGFIIAIPKGKEFEFMCRLELDNRGKVHAVQLNSLESTN